MTASIAPFIPRYFVVTLMLEWRIAKSSLGEIILALLGLDIVDMDLCDRGSRRTSVQVLLELFQSTAVTLGLTSDLPNSNQHCDICRGYTTKPYGAVILVLDIAGDA
jgi:hypothetical protein